MTRHRVPRAPGREELMRTVEMHLAAIERIIQANPNFESITHVTLIARDPANDSLAIVFTSDPDLQESFEVALATVERVPLTKDRTA